MVGDRVLTKVTAQDLHDWYIGFQTPKFEDDPPMLPKAKSCMEQFVRLLQFGIMTEIDGCARLAQIIKGVGTSKNSRNVMTFTGGPRRNQELTLDHVIAFCAKAHEGGQHSLALATVLQFESMARQADIIGQWWPVSDATAGTLVQVNRKNEFMQWRGLTWGIHVSTDLIMTKPTSKSRGRKKAIADLSLSPLVLAELEKIPAEKRIGPVVISEYTGLPYQRKTFNRAWRQIARAAGIPDDVQNCGCWRRPEHPSPRASRIAPATGPHLLTEPRNTKRPISDIAFEAGFTDISHFNRLFRSRFGDTPRGVRGQA